MRKTRKTTKRTTAERQDRAASEAERTEAERIRAFEAEGLTTSDAQAAAGAEEIRAVRRTREEFGDEAADFIEGILDENPEMGF